MPIRIDRFGGIAPRLDPEKLPESGAQIAHNCSLVRHVIEPLTMAAPFVSLHNDDGTMVSQLAAADVFAMPIPDRPSVAATVVRDAQGNVIAVMTATQYLCSPWVLAGFLKVVARVWVSWVDTNGATETKTVLKLQEVVLTPDPASVRYSETGLSFQVTLPQFTQVFNQIPNRVYTVHGPCFQFILTYNVPGGPDNNYSIPPQYTELDSIIPASGKDGWHVPLINAEGNIFANLQIADYSGPIYDNIVDPEQAQATWAFPENGSTTVTFSVDMNYPTTRKHLFYVATAVTPGVPTPELPDPPDIEGPPSLISTETILLPGQYVNVSLAFPTGYTRLNLYRSGTGGNDFLLLAKLASAPCYDPNNQIRMVNGAAPVFQDDGRATMPMIIPPYGNPPPEISLDEFRENSILHPAQFAVAKYRNKVYVSDFYRFWAWPQQYVLPFPDAVDAMAASSKGVLVWTGGKVYGLIGQHPASLEKALGSTSTPLLNKLSLCSIGQAVFFATKDGVADARFHMWTGCEVEVITSDQFRREQWEALGPEDFAATIADQSIFFTRPDGTGLRLDVISLSPKEQQKQGADIAISTFDTLDPGSTFIWKSKLFRSDTATIFDYIRLVASGPITLTIWGDGAQVFNQVIADDTPVSLIGVVPYAKEWEFQLSGQASVRMLHAYDRQIIPAQPMTTLTPQQVPLWRDIWLKFEDANRFVGGTLTVPGGGPVPMNIYADGTSLVFSQTITSGDPFTLPRDCPRTTLWRVECATELTVERLDLWTRETVQALNDIRELHSGGLPAWRRKRYEIPDKSCLTGATVHSLLLVTLNIYKDGAVAPSLSLTIPEGGRVRIPEIGPCKGVELDFGGHDRDVTELTINISPLPDIGPEGIRIVNPPSWMGNRFKFADAGALVAGAIGVHGLATVTLTLYADNVQVYSRTWQTKGEAFQLPPLVKATQWEVCVDAVNEDGTSAEIESLVLMPRMRVIADKAVKLSGTDVAIQPWLYQRYVFPEGTELLSAMLKSDTYPLVLNITTDTGMFPVTVTDGSEFKLPVMGRIQWIEFNVTD